MKLTIHLPGETRTLEPAEPELLSEALLQAGVMLAMPCGGRGRCGKCRVTAHGSLSPVSERERTALSESELAAGVRLACLTRVTGDAVAELTAGRREEIVTEGRLPAFPSEPLGLGLGIAIDIGTTTLAAYLYDLPAGKLLATATALNPQAPFGADVISRLQKSHEGQGAILAAAIRGGLDSLIGRLCGEAGAERGAVDAMVLTGNTAMLYLLTGQKPDSLIAVPFVQDRSFGERLAPEELGLTLPGCETVYLTRCISAYVGADITMSSMASELFRRTAEDEPCLMCDIGTNGEMVLAAGGRWYCCSTAAGPTFEGAGIHMGMTARAGAISRVWLEDGAFRCRVIGGGKAEGLCGTGIIDAVAAMLETGVVDETGYLCEEGHAFGDCVEEFGNSTAFRLPGTDVLITQGDVRAVQLAKAAICAGMLTLLHEAGLDGAVPELKIAGGFGSFIDVNSAERIGLIPPGFAARAEAIGNAAGAGASMVLLSRPMLEASQRFSREAQTVELSTSKFFMEKYPENMLFGTEA